MGCCLVGYVPLQPGKSLRLGLACSSKVPKQDERKVTDDSATVSPHPHVPLPIPTQVTPTDPPLALMDTSNIENVDEYLYHGRSSNKKRNMEIAYVYNTIFSNPPPRD